jgi:Flp pilus assembly protein TadG
MKTLPQPRRGAGVATVEFAIVAMVFLTLLFGILEIGRLMYVYNSLQEVTRRAAREATVRWIDDQAEVRTLALFGGAALPGGAEITSASIKIEYLDATGAIVSTYPANPGDNLSACGDATRVANCIFSVRVSIDNIKYSPMITLFSFLNVTMPTSTVTMHAESMGFESS